MEIFRDFSQGQVAAELHERSISIDHRSGRDNCRKLGTVYDSQVNRSKVLTRTVIQKYLCLYFDKFCVQKKLHDCHKLLYKV